jgi:hypothetical protein
MGRLPLSGLWLLMISPLLSMLWLGLGVGFVPLPAGMALALALQPGLRSPMRAAAFIAVGPGSATVPAIRTQAIL